MKPSQGSAIPTIERARVMKQGKPNSFMSKITKFMKELWGMRLSYLFLAPFLICFVIFILVPVAMAFFLSFTSFNGIGTPKFIGFHNYITMFTQDFVFMRNTLPNTLRFAIIVGPGGYILSFIFAWLIHQLHPKIRKYYTLALFAPSMAAGVGLSVIWIATFSGDRVGYLNNILIRFGMIESPMLWLQDPRYLMWIMIIVSLWTSMGVGFLAMLGGLQTVNTELYEAGRIDGIKNRLQEVYYITIPSMKPQMLFSAVMSIAGTLRAGDIGSILTGMTVSPNYAGHLISNHIEDYAFLRYEWGYASALSVFLMLLGYLLMRLSYSLFRTKEDE